LPPLLRLISDIISGAQLPLSIKPPAYKATNHFTTGQTGRILVLLFFCSSVLLSRKPRLGTSQEMTEHTWLSDNQSLHALLREKSGRKRRDSVQLRHTVRQPLPLVDPSRPFHSEFRGQTAFSSMRSALAAAAFADSKRERPH
jgi:hypothetical protein